MLIMNEITNNKIKLFYPVYNTVNHSIDKEIYRGILYCTLLKNFSKSCLSNLNEKIFSHKKTTNRTLTNLLSSWFFTLYHYSDFTNDPFFPTNYNHTDILKKTIEDYCSMYAINNVQEKINKIIIDLLSNYSNLLIKLNEYTDKDSHIKITKIKINQERNSIIIPFYRFILDSTKYNIASNKLNNIINNIILPIEQYNIMESRYKQSGGDINLMDNLIWIILYRYQLLSSNNNQLAVLESILARMTTDFNLSCECFASSINSSFDNYCSIYYDVERYFGSIGSFFNITPIQGTYSFNPPYQYDIINDGIEKIILDLDNTTFNLSFIITIPIWDIEGKEYMATNMTENNNNIIKYDDFNIINIIKQSKYFKGLRMISKDNFTYFDHNFYLFKNKTIQNTYVIIMSNCSDCSIDIINTYDFFTFENI
jgi:hypothetical protein